LPTLGQLQPLALDSSQLGSWMFASNNPETVSGYGVLASTFAVPTGSRADGANFPNSANAPSGGLSGSMAVDAACPAGAVRDASVYIAHIMSVPGYVGLGVWATGDLDVGPWDTRGESFVSARVTRDYFFNANATARRVPAPANRYTQLDAAGGKDGYVDGRLRVRAAGGQACFYLYTVAQPGATLAQVPEGFAKGNVAWPGWWQGQGAGRVAGLYAGDWRVGRQSFSLPGPGFLRGYKIATAEQSIQAAGRYNDSAQINFGNYGTLYDQTFDITNAGSSCMNVRSELVSYAGVGADQAPTYEVYNAADKLLSVYWNGPVARLTGAGTSVEPAILFVDKRPGATGPVPTMRKGIDVLRVEPGQTGTLRHQLPVPGLITSPAAFVFTSERCN
jgi:hypothetical protein